jgi:hypothetical protein
MGEIEQNALSALAGMGPRQRGNRPIDRIGREIGHFGLRSKEQ